MSIAQNDELEVTSNRLASKPVKTIKQLFTYMIHIPKNYNVCMMNITPKIIFSSIPSIRSPDRPHDEENRKISYWLEKLYIQGEEVRKDTNRREEQTKVDAANEPSPEQHLKKNDQNLTQLGINTHKRNAATKVEADRRMVNDLVRRSNRCIISISSSFPWNLFPDTVDVEESRVTFKFSQFLSSQSHSVDIKDISNVFIETSMFFATLQVVSRTYIQNDIKIGHLNKKEAILVQRIIEGLRTFAENKINTSNYEIDELISKIREFHNAHIS